MNIVHYSQFAGKITENWIANTASALALKENIIFYSVFCDDAAGVNFKTRCLKKEYPAFIFPVIRMIKEASGAFGKMDSWLKQDKPDLIHAHFGPRGWEMSRYAQKYNIPLITSFYGEDAYRFPKNILWRKRYRVLFNIGALFLAEGPAMRTQLIKRGCPENKIQIHHIGIDTSGYSFIPREISSDGNMRLLLCGRFCEKKGIIYALKTLKCLVAGGSEGSTLTIAGDSDRKGSMTPLKKEIIETIRSLRLTKNVTITGYIPHDKLKELILSHHVLLVPSVHAKNGDAEGGFPVVVTEAMATGMPVAGFNHCDIPYIVNASGGGIVVPEKDFTALAKALAGLAKDPGKMKEFGSNGRKYIEGHYDLKNLSAGLLEKYAGVINGKK